jgi:DNA-binding FadR family transcriptional regulator
MPFKITRSDGRSNAQVLLDHFKHKEPGTVFEYDELRHVLSVNTNHVYSVHEIRAICAAIYPRLLKEQARALHNVRTVGYRLAPAAFHVTLASGRQNRADRQMLRGVQTLQHVKWEEMTQNERMAHEGQLMICGALYQQMQALERRQSVIEDAIRRVREPIEKEPHEPC